MNKDKLSYRDAGVDIDQASALVDDIKKIAKKTHRPGVMAQIGGFGALFEIPEHFKKPVLVSGTDGVGTKLKLAIELDKHDTIGIDLVAMCANDIVCLGAEPLYFLDYFATGKLNSQQAAAILSGIGKGCEQAGAALIGGETAEMPGMYHGNDYDLAGFCVGAVEKEHIIDGSNVHIGDSIIGLSSSGPHSNGFSLIRKILELNHNKLTDTVAGLTLAEHLLAPTRMYVKPILTLLKQFDIHALAHITGGGLYENIPRVLPKHTKAIIHKNSWQIPAIFAWLQEHGNVDPDEMLRTFNMGVGMVIVVNAKETAAIIDCLNQMGETAWQIGSIEKNAKAMPEVNLQ